MYITIVAVLELELDNFSTPSCDQFGHYRDYEKNLVIKFAGKFANVVTYSWWT